MLKKIFIFLITLSFVMPVYAAGIGDAFKTEPKSNLFLIAEEGAGYTNQGEAGLETRIGQIITTVLSLLGVIFLGLIIYAGYLWMMARGNQKDVDKAKEILTQAIIGLIVVVAAYTISYFVINSLGTGQLNNLETKTTQ